MINTVCNDDSDDGDSCNDDYDIFHTMIKTVWNDVDDSYNDAYNGYDDQQTPYIKYMIHDQKRCELVWTFSDKYVFQTVTIAAIFMISIEWKAMRKVKENWHFHIFIWKNSSSHGIPYMRYPSFIQCSSSCKLNLNVDSYPYS